MFRVFEFIIESVGFVAIVLSPTIIGLGIGFMSYRAIGDVYGEIAGIIISIIGFVLGLLLAVKKWKNGGTVHFLSRISATPEIDFPSKIIVKATIKFLPAIEGKVIQILKKNVKLNHYFGTLENFSSKQGIYFNNGELIFEEDSLNKAETNIAKVRFVHVKNIENIEVGTKLFLCFEQTLIGEGEVIEIYYQQATHN